MSWTDASGGARRAYLAQSLNGGAWTKTTVTGTTQKAYAAMGVGAYAYKVQIYTYDAELRKELFEYETPAVTVQVWKSIPAAPGAITGPASSASGNYTLTWTAPPGVVTSYEVLEGATLVASPTTTSLSLSGKPSGTYTYQVRACNGLGCGPYGPVFTVGVSVNLTTVVPDADVGTDEALPQGWVGRIPGMAAVDGGAAGYRIDIEVPPGRLGVQPSLSLAYSSRSGNGAVGVGWSLSAASTIYRCPRTLEQEGANRPVLLDSQDRLCMGGQRLVQVGSGPYGEVDSEYRTEVEQFDRVRLVGAGFMSAQSTFVVEHKSGMVSHYEARLGAVPGVPDAWQLVREFDPQGNCIDYQYATLAVPGGGQEPSLTRIAYTGTMDQAGLACVVPASGRVVTFSYTFDRPDKRTTYLAGTAKYAHARLSAIATFVGSAPARRWELDYGPPSLATRRSLLREVRQPCVSGTTGACTGIGLPATKLTYAEEAPTFDQDLGGRGRFKDPEDPNKTLREGWVVSAEGDYDGDGTRDKVYRNYRLGTQASKLQLSWASAPGGGGPTISTFPEEIPIPTFRDQIDLNQDGRADLIGSKEGELVIWSLAKIASGSGTATPTDYYWKETPLDIQAQGAVSLDYDGDGLVDMGVSDGFGLAIARQLPGSHITFAPSIPTPQPMTQWERAQAPRDLNGDGTLDACFDSTSSAPIDARVQFFKGFDQGFTQSKTILEMFGPGGDFNHGPPRRWIDVNGDGLPDIWEPDKIYLNQGGAVGAAPTFAEKAIEAVVNQAGTPLTLTLLERRRQKFAFAMDVDADGIEEVMVPTTRVPGYEFCGRDPSSYPSPPPEQYVWCGDDFDDILARDELDKSVFYWDAYKVVPDAAGKYQMVRIETNLVARAGGTVVGNSTPTDLNGDGLPDLTFSLLEETGTTSTGDTVWFGWYPNATEQETPSSTTLVKALGPYGVRAIGHAPDLMATVEDGLGLEAAWTYQPLSEWEVAAPGCDATKPFYSADNEATHPDGYVFFTSSMWAVSSSDARNGLRKGPVAAPRNDTNRTCYRYQDAMLNVRGRGFQGFKQIIAEERLPVAMGEDPAGDETCGDASAAPCSPNNLITTTQFNQEFPFTNTPRKVSVEAAADGTRLAETTSWWHAVQAASGGPWVRYQTASTENKFDPKGGALLATNTSVTELDLTSGEAVKICTISSDVGMSGVYEGLPPAVTPQLTTLSQETRDLTSDSGPWWLGRLDSSKTLVGPFSGSFPDLELRAATTRSDDPEPLAPEACPSPTDLVLSKQVTTAYEWYEANAPVEQRRKLKLQTVSPGGASEPELQTSFTYGAYGNPLTRTVTARAVLGANSLPLEHTTTTGPSTDGYFIETETNAKDHVSTTQRDAATGQVIFQQEVLGGPTVTTTLDALGRPITTSRLGSQPVNLRTVACSALQPSSAAPCEPLEVMARQTTQAGAPTRTEYLDLLGRVLRTATVSMDGSLLVTEVAYNERGLKVAEYAPRVAGASGYPTLYSGLDLLGRPTRKEVQRSGSIFEDGTATGPLVTTYKHSGHTTDIVADNGGPMELAMSRTYDAKGRLVKTVQQIDGRKLAVQYVYEPSGALTHVVDQAKNFIEAKYDALGRKIRVSDPDRGTWAYAWDGLGRLQFQTDARGRVTTQEYDVLSRLVKRTSVLEAGTPEIADWTYDESGQQGLLTTEKDSNDFVREYQYDSLRRPTKVTTTIPAADAAQPSGERKFTMEYGYDRNHGRLKATRYPSKVNTIGETVALDYDARGYLIGEVALDANFVRTKTYRKVLGMSERGQVTDQLLGNCVRETGVYDASTGVATALHANRPMDPQASLPMLDLTACSYASGVVRQDDYHYDRFLNLKRQTKNVQGLQREEEFEYDALQRLTKATLCTGANCTADTEVVDYTYDDLGNLTKKTDYGASYMYGAVTWDAGTDPNNPRWVRSTGNAGPHAVRQVTKASVAGGGVADFTYDDNGNLVDGDGRGIDYDLMDRPVRVRMGEAETGPVTEFAYGPTGGRYRQKLTGTSTEEKAFGPKTVYYVDKDYELTVWGADSSQPGVLEERTFIGASVTVLTKKTATGVTTRSVRYRHVDRLGSPDADTAEDVAATLVEAHGFDAWGRPRDGSWLPSGDRLHPGGEPETTSTRGFTGHEHLDSAYLIHMNGRVYDYRLGRFLSVDPIISNPLSSQAINPYSYIGNNPLSGTDPTGYMSVGTGCGAFSRCDVIMVNPSPSTQRMYAPSNASSGAIGASSRQAGTNPASTQDPKETAQNNLQPAETKTQPASSAGGAAQGGSVGVEYDYEALAKEAQQLVSNIENSGFKKFDSQTEARLATLHPAVGTLARMHLELLGEYGINATLYETLRTYETQNRYYAQGRTTPGPIITNARGGESFHNFGVAYDLRLSDGQGKFISDGTHADYRLAGHLGEELGLTWGGRWTKPYDPPHFEYSNGIRLQTMQLRFERGVDVLTPR